MSHSCNGNAITEYVLPGMLVTVVCISGFLVLGGQFNNSMLDLKKLMNASSGTAQKQASLHNQQAAEAIRKTPSLPVIPVPTQGMQTFSGSPQQTREIISTLGANGATDVLANQIGLLTTRWTAERKISAVQSSTLLKLANEGHQLAQYQKMVSDAFLQGKSNITVAGKSYSIIEGTGFNSMSMDDVWNLNPQTANPLTRPFAQTYHDFLKENANLDPALNQQISSLAVQISAVDDGLKWAAEDLLGGRNSQNTITDASLWDTASRHFQDNITGASTGGAGQVSVSAKDLTHHNSAEICTTGQGHDAGQHCSP